MGSYYEKFLSSGEVKCIDDEIPYEIPQGWEWCRLSSLTALIEDCPHTTAKDEGKGYPLIRTPNIGFGRLDFKGVHRVCEDTYQKRNIRAIPQVGDLIFAREAPAGNIAVIQEREIVCLGQRTVLIRPLPNTIIPDYLAYYILSPFSQEMLVGNSTGTTVPHVNLADFRPYLIAVPPLSEQICIVTKINDCLPWIDKYEKVKAKLNTLNNELCSKTRKSILQEAIQGKLVPQLPEEGTAEELLVKIHKEKECLVKEGKLKKSALTNFIIYKGDDNKYWEKNGKNLKDITDEIPFEIPDSWAWMRLYNLCNIINGFTPLKAEAKFWNDGTINWFTVEDINSQGEYIYNTSKKISTLAADKNRISRAGSVLLCCTASVGRCAMTMIPTTTNQQFNALSIKEEYRCLVDDNFLFLFVKTLEPILHDLAGKTTFEFISVKKVSNILIPIPPIQEQYRIIQTVNKTLASIMSR